jgi:hypothetical protein
VAKNVVPADEATTPAILHKSGVREVSGQSDSQLPKVSSRASVPLPRLTTRVQPMAAHHPASRSVGGTSPFTVLHSHTGLGGAENRRGDSTRLARGGCAAGEIARTPHGGKRKSCKKHGKQLTGNGVSSPRIGPGDTRLRTQGRSRPEGRVGSPRAAYHARGQYLDHLWLPPEGWCVPRSAYWRMALHESSGQGQTGFGCFFFFFV